MRDPICYLGRKGECCRALAIGNHFYGEIWIDGRPFFSVLKPPQPRMTFSQNVTKKVTDDTERFRVYGSYGPVLIYVGDGEPFAPGGLEAIERARIELAAIAAIDEELPAEWEQNRFWLCRALWLAHNAFEEAFFDAADRWRAQKNFTKALRDLRRRVG